MKKLFSMILLVAGTALCASAQSKVWQALWSEDNTTLYFAYSSATLAAGDSYTPESGGGPVTLTNVWNGNTNGGISNRSWNGTVRSKVTTVVFEPSFKSFRPDYCHYWFSGCSQLKTVKGTENFIADGVKRMDEMFSGCTVLESIDLSGLNTAQVTTVQSMFNGCKALKSAKLTGWTNNALSTVSNMFNNCEALETVSLSGFNTSGITNFTQMFGGCKSLQSIDLSSFNTASAMGMGNMFKGCEALQSVNMSGWNVEKVTNINNMFSGCAALLNLDLSSWKNEVLTDINSAFYNCTSLKSVDLSGLYTVKLTNTSNLFYGCTALEKVSVSNGWTMSAVTSSGNMFRNCTSIIGQDGTTYDANATDKTRAHYGPGGYLRHNAAGDIAIDPSPAALWCADNATLYFTKVTALMPAGTQYVTDGGATITVSDAWYGDAILAKPSSMNTQIWIPTVRNTMEHVVVESAFAQVQPTSVEWWMQNCNKLVDVTGMENLDLSKVTSLRQMFSGCSALTSVSFAGKDLSKVTNLYQCFYNCTALKSVNLSGTNLSGAKSFDYMFSGCSSLESVTIGGFLNEVADNMTSMFSNCPALKSVDLSAFRTLKLYNTSSMFNGCSALVSVSVGNGWSLAGVSYSGSMFNGCTSIVGQDGTTYDSTSTDKTRAHYGPGGYLRHNPAGDIAIDPVPAAVWCADNATLYLTWTTTLLPPGTPYVTESGATVPVTTAWLGDDVLARPYTTHPYHVWGPTVSGSLQHVVIESAFAQAHPTEVVMWFYGCSKLEDVTGMANLKLDKATSISNMFYGCSSLKSVDLEKLDASTVKIANALFQGCAALESVDLSALAAAPLSGQALYDMFNGCSSLKSVDVSMLNAAAVTATFRMFKDCAALESINFGEFNTAANTNMLEMFNGCSSLTTLDLSTFDTRKVQNMNSLFAGCSKLKSVYVGSYWMVGNASGTDMFTGCEAIVGEHGTTYDASATDRSRAHYGVGGYLRKGRMTTLDTPVPAAVWCADNTTLYFTYTDSPVFVGGIFTPAGTDEGHLITAMWSEGSVLNSGDYSTPAWIAYVKESMTRAVVEPSFASVKPVTLYGWFRDCANLEQIDGLKNLNTSEATVMAWMFEGCSKLANIDLSGFNTQKVNDMNTMFYNMPVTELDLSSFMPFSVEYMGEMFSGCASLKTIKVNSYWNIESRVQTRNMFAGCVSIVGQDGTTYNASSTGGERAHYGTGGYLTHGDDPVVDEPMPFVIITTDGTAYFLTDKKPYRSGGEFRPADGAAKTVNIVIAGNDVLNYKWWKHIDGWEDDGLNIIKAVVIEPSFASLQFTSLESYFDGLAAVTSFTGLEHINTAEVTNMSWMFYKCSSLTELDLSTFNTSKVGQMVLMFGGCSKLKSIYVSSTWTTAFVQDDGFMFEDCEAIVGEDGTTYIEDEIDGSRAHYCAGGYLRHGTDAVIEPTPAVAFCNETNSLHFYVTTTPVVWGGAFTVPGTSTTRIATRAAMGERVTVGETGIIPDWLVSSDHQDVTTAVIDPSFASVKPVNVAAWFYRCNALRLINGLEYLDTSEATDMMAMFYECRNLLSLDLSTFDTRKVQNMSGMFASCSMLESVFIGDKWSTDAVTNSDVMFFNCYAIVGEDGTKYNPTAVDATRAHAGAGGYLRMHHSQYAVRMPAQGFTVFSAAETVLIPAGVEAYACTAYDSDASTVTARKLTTTTIPANTGVLLRGSAGATYDFRSLLGIEPDEPYDAFLDGNLLMPATVPTLVRRGVMDSYDDDLWIVLNLVLDNGKFQPVIRLQPGESDGILLPANSAYLSLNDEREPAAADGASIVWQGSGDPYDVNGDGNVDVGDVNMVLAAILNHDNPSALDVNHDGHVDVGDVNAILQRILTK